MTMKKVSFFFYFRIHGYLIFFIIDSTNEFTKKLRGFSIIVSNTTDPWDGVVCYHNTNTTIETIPAVVDIPCSVVGRYVIYYNERLTGITYSNNHSQFAFADLCEVEVLGKLIFFSNDEFCFLSVLVGTT